jgi:glutathione S-transferase
MLKLCGFHLSNYHNKVRIALLEKGIPFEEDAEVKPSQDEAYIAKSPMGKVPYAEIDGRRLCESEVIVEYREDRFPQKPLLPKDPLERAKVRELVTMMELHMELVARRLYREVFFGGRISDEAKESVRKDLAKGIRAFKALAKFDPFLAGRELTLADCAAAVHLPLISSATKLAFGRDALEEVPQVKPYLKMLGERPAFARENADNKAARQALVAAAQAKK